MADASIDATKLELRLHLNCAGYDFTDAQVHALRQVASPGIKEVRCADKAMRAAAMLFFDGKKDPQFNQLTSRESDLRGELKSSKSTQSEGSLQGQITKVSSDRQQRLQLIIDHLEALLNASPSVPAPKNVSPKPKGFWDGLLMVDRAPHQPKPETPAPSIRKQFMQICNPAQKICTIAIENMGELPIPAAPSGAARMPQSQGQP